MGEEGEGGNHSEVFPKPTVKPVRIKAREMEELEEVAVDEAVEEGEAVAEDGRDKEEVVVTKTSKSRTKSPPICHRQLPVMKK